jgi:BirA family transcriptional regulator, biotin operon repressor / biotin---[acetyl-CoA-carboxylase] ligase
LSTVDTRFGPATDAEDRPFVSRQERFAQVGSTNDVVREWLADGTPEVCLAVADEQTAGRGREGRTWQAPPGSSFLCSLGFRPTWLAPDRTWRLAAIVSLAMADAAEEVAGLPDQAIRLKWPNDLVVETTGVAGVRLANASGPEAGRLLDAPLEVRKLAGVLGETIGLGSADPRVIIGLGLNADWAGADFPPELAATMTSLRVASNGRPIELADLFAAFIDRVEARTIALRGGHFDVADWTTRQLTSGRPVRLDLPGGASLETRALGVDTGSGGLVVEDLAAPGGERTILTGEIEHLRLPVGV